MGPHASNAKGHFEPLDIANLHDELLGEAGSAWNDCREFPAHWFGSAAAAAYRRRLVAVTAQNYGGARLAVLKEPRMCRLLPLWDGVFADLGAEPAFCFVDRHPMEVAASLHARDGSSLAQGLRFYIRNHLDAEHATRGRRRVFVAYDSILADWRRSMDHVAAVLGLNFPGRRTQEAEVDAFLDRGMRHQSAEALPGKPTAEQEMAMAVHGSFARLAREGSTASTLAALDKLRKNFNAWPFNGGEQPAKAQRRSLWAAWDQWKSRFHHA